MDTSRMKVAGAKLSVEALTVKTNDNCTLVNNITFNVLAESRFCIVGESGAGKTIVGRAIAGLLPRGVRVSSGQVRVAPIFKGNSVHVTMVPQLTGAILPPLMSVFSFLNLVTRWNGNDDPLKREKIIIKLLDRIGFPSGLDPRHTRPHQLSGGLAQRVSLAAALATQPAILILDEPTSNLDPLTAKNIVQLLHSINLEEKMTLILITHDPRLVLNLCTEYVILRKGELFLKGLVNQLNQTHDSYVKQIFSLD
ncbi:MAG: ATP-binding cassette domain-containing protein [Thermodesulfobacteriota bacterium]